MRPIAVAELPTINQIREGACYRLTGNHTDPKYTHYLFRFPARFHVPVVRWILDELVTDRENTVLLDPFNGSGTSQVEAAVRGIRSVGIDIDPVATFIARAKSTPIDPQVLENDLQGILASLETIRRKESEYQRRLRPEDDISEATFARQTAGLDIPDHANLQHWFRRYVIIDLARIRQVIETAITDPPAKHFFLTVFASVIRSASNADPVPVSGLEYTRVMRERDQQGRYINPYGLFKAKATRAVEAMGEFYGQGRRHGLATTLRGNALLLVEELAQQVPGVQPTLILTSPPYLTAVEYHRRHTLEAFWLRLTETEESYRATYHDYIGRHRILQRDVPPKGSVDVPHIDALLTELSNRGDKQEHAIRTYFRSMQQVLRNFAQILPPGGHAIIAISDNTTNRRMPIETQRFFRSIARYYDLVLEHAFCYEVRNRYMQYTRRNNADIDREWILAFVRR